MLKSVMESVSILEGLIVFVSCSLLCTFLLSSSKRMKHYASLEI